MRKLLLLGILVLAGCEVGIAEDSSPIPEREGIRILIEIDKCNAFHVTQTVRHCLDNLAKRIQYNEFE